LTTSEWIKDKGQRGFAILFEYPGVRRYRFFADDQRVGIRPWQGRG